MSRLKPDLAPPSKPSKTKLLPGPASFLSPRVFAVIGAVALVGIIIVKFSLASSTQAGLTAQYYSNETLSGTPVVTRVDPQVNYNWGTSAPASGVSATSFSVRWSGNVTPTATGTYQIYTASDDGVRVWMGGQLVVNSWTNHGSMENSGSIHLTAGTSYPVKVEYYQHTGQALVSLQWSSNNAGIARTVIPQSMLTATVQSSPTPTPSATPSTSVTPVPTPTPTPTPTPSTTNNKVTRNGSQLYLNGKPYRIIGLDLPAGAVASWSEPPLPTPPYPYADGSNLANYLTKIRATAPHMNTIWIFALQQFATNNGVRDWSSFDKVLSVANQYGFKVVMNLEDSWSYERLGTHNPALDTTWFNGGYKNTVLTHEQIPYRQWVQEVVTHYKNDPRISVWQPIAEPNAITLSFAQDVSGLVKSIDPVTPVSFDEVGPLSSSFYALPGLDIPSYHYYADFGQTNYLAVANAAKAAGKPWVMFEYGVNSSVGLTTRANTIKSFLPTMFSAPNASGFLNWQNPPYILNPGDPALPIIDSYVLP